MNIFEGSRRIAKLTAAGIAAIARRNYAHEFWILRSFAAKLHARSKGGAHAK